MAPTKDCPTTWCGKSWGQKKQKCDCGYQFPFKKKFKSKEPAAKHKRLCPCGESVGSATKTCPHCRHAFASKPKQASKGKVCACGESVGNATKTCPHCKHAFVLNKKKRKEPGAPPRCEGCGEACMRRASFCSVCEEGHRACLQDALEDGVLPQAAATVRSLHLSIATLSRELLCTTLHGALTCACMRNSSWPRRHLHLSIATLSRELLCTILHGALTCACMRNSGWPRRHLGCATARADAGGRARTGRIRGMQWR